MHSPLQTTLRRCGGPLARVSVWIIVNIGVLGLIRLLGRDSGAEILILPLTGWPALLLVLGATRRPREFLLSDRRFCVALGLIPWLELAIIERWHLFPEAGFALPASLAERRDIRLAFLALTASFFQALFLKFHDRVVGLEATSEFYRAQVHEAEFRNTAFLGAIPDTMLMLSAGGEILDYYFRPEDSPVPLPRRFLGRKMTDVHVSQELADGLLPKIQAALQSETVQLLNYRITAPTGKDERRFEARLVRSGPEQVLMISRDVSQEWKVRQELELQRTHQRAQMISSSRLSLLGEMAGGVAHEINNPLAVIQGHACLLQDPKTSAKPETVLVSARKIEASVERISRIVQSLRTFAREPSDDPVARVRFSSLLVAPLELCREKMRNHGVSFRLGAIPEGLEIQCQPAQISQAILHLITNAFDSVRGGTDAWVELSVDDQSCSSSVTVRVTDSGRGVPASLRDRVFDPFFTTKEPGRGTGLGLSICLGVAESHGGSLHLAIPEEGTEGCTSQFILRLPRKIERFQTPPARHGVMAAPTL